MYGAEWPGLQSGRELNYTKGGMQGGRQVAGPADRTRQSQALARLLATARGTENCKQSSCCCAVFR
jgi:hypothetical protein